jgi:hypothetical protein
MTMTTLVHPPGEPDLLDFLAALANEPLPPAPEDRRSIETAVERCITEHDGLVHIAWVRPHIDRDVRPHMVGAVMSALARRDRWVWTGEYADNGGPSKNAAKPARIWRARPKETP